MKQSQVTHLRGQQTAVEKTKDGCTVSILGRLGYSRLHFDSGGRFVGASDEPAFTAQNAIQILAAFAVLAVALLAFAIYSSTRPFTDYGLGLLGVVLVLLALAFYCRKKGILL